MEKHIAIFTFFLFAVSTSCIALAEIGPPAIITVESDAADIAQAQTGPPAIITSESEKSVDKTAANDRLPESGVNTQAFEVSSISSDPAPIMIFSRPHLIQRHSLDRSNGFIRRHPCRKFKKTLKRSYGNDMISSDEIKTISSVDLEAIGDQIPIKSLEFKRVYGHRHLRHYLHHDNNNKKKKEEKFEIEKEREHKGGFMRRVRKFLKHTFD